MEKYVHTRLDKPKEGSIIVVFRNKLPKIVQVSELYWTLNNTFITSWYYVEDLENDIKNLSKYLRAYNYYRDEIKEMIEGESDPAVVEKLTNLYQKATDIIQENVENG